MATKRPLIYVWLFRRHASYPELIPGINYVDEDVAKAVIRDGCAQDHTVDSRRLKHITNEPAFKPVPKPAAKVSRPAGPAKKPRTYKRRDIQAER